MSPPDNSVPFMSLDYGEVNPNHKLKLLALFVPENRWVANMAFARNDDSIYLAPQFDKDVTVVGLDKEKVAFSVSSPPDGEVHISLHGSGVVNLSIQSESHRLRNPHEQVTPEVITFGIKEPQGLRVAPDNEVNSLPARYTVVPVPGFFTIRPVFVTIFRVRPGDTWEMPQLSHTLQTHVGFGLKGKDTRYEIVVWQNPEIPDFPGDIAYSLAS